MHFRLMTDLTPNNICEKGAKIFKMGDTLVCHQPVYLSFLGDSPVCLLPGKVLIQNGRTSTVIVTSLETNAISHVWLVVRLFILNILTPLLLTIHDHG